MITAALFLFGTYYLSRTTPPPHFDSWEEIRSKVNNQPK